MKLIGALQGFQHGGLASTFLPVTPLVLVRATVLTRQQTMLLARLH